MGMKAHGIDTETAEWVPHAPTRYPFHAVIHQDYAIATALSVFETLFDRQDAPAFNPQYKDGEGI